MKRSVLVLISAICLFMTAIAQENSQKPVRLGLNLSPNLGWIKPSSKGYSSKSSVLGFSYGIISEFQLVDNYVIATGLQIKANGGKLKYPEVRVIDTVTVEGNLTRKYKLRYLEIPLLLKMKTRQIGTFSYFGTFGLGTSFKLSAVADDDFMYDKSSHVEPEDIDIGSDVSFLRESLIIGVGAEYSLGGSTSVVISIFFNNGFTDILSGINTKDSTIKEKATSKQLELNIGVIF